MKFTDATALIEKELKTIDWKQMPSGIIDPVHHILELGGKRIRPAITVLACDIFCNHPQHAVPAALGVELFHNSSLLHDDLMDNSDIRRNKPTVHVKWNANTAILSGDLMIVKSFDLVNQSVTSNLKAVLDVFSEITAGVCAGQQYDLDFETRDDVSVDEYIHMIKHKTAVLLAGSLKMGALIGGASKTDADLIYNFGINLGLSFQLQDDYLDVFGDVKDFGKAIGNDIVSNKKTFLLITALQKAKGKTKSDLENWISKTDFDREDKVSAISQIYTSLEIDKLSKEQSEKYFTESLNSLEAISVSNESKDELLKLAKALLNRNK